MILVLHYQYPECLCVDTFDYNQWYQVSIYYARLYFSHPDSRYFGLGKINRDQVKDYAHRKGMEIRQMERWLSPSLGYDSEEIEQHIFHIISEINFSPDLQILSLIAGQNKTTPLGFLKIDSNVRTQTVCCECRITKLWKTELQLGIV